MRQSKRASIADRVGSGVAAAGILAVLVVAAMLEPNADGHGTHEQLGLPTCGFVALFDKPCVSCGMTTAFATLADARPIEAFLIQPAGALLALLGATLIWPLLHVCLFGSRLLDDLSALARPKVVWLGMAILGVSWLYKWMTW